MAWGYKRTVAVQAAKVPSTQSNFPVLFHSTNDSFKSVANGGKITHASGYDLAFYSDAALTTQLSHEIVYHSLTTGEVYAWVKIPSLSSSGTTYYVAYGDSGISASQENATDVWSNGFQAVWHCDESSGNLTDATGNGYTLYGANLTYQQSGKIKYSILMNSSTDTLTISGSVKGTTPVSHSCWFKTSDVSATVQFLVADQKNAAYTDRYVTYTTSGKVRAHTSHGGSYPWAESTNTTAANTWAMAYGVYSGAASRVAILNGDTANKGTDTTSNVPAGLDHFEVGRNNAVDKYPLSGYVEEVRVHNLARSDDWVKTDYNTQSDPASFYTLGSETSTYTTQNRTISGSSRIRKTQTRTQAGSSRIRVTQIYQQAGSSRIQTTSSETISGAARITASSSQAISGSSRIETTSSRTITGSSAIVVTTTQNRTISGASRIEATQSQAISGASRIEATSSQTISGAARISTTSSETISGASRIGTTSSETISGSSRITATQTQTISGSSAISSGGVPQQIISGSFQSPSSSSTSYHDLMGGGANGFSNTETNRQQVMPTAGTLTNFQFQVKTAPGNGKTWTISVRKNGATTALSQSISGASTYVSALDTDTVSVAAGDLVNIIVENQANPANPDAVYWACEFIPDTAGETILLANSGGNDWTAGNYGTLIANKNPDTQETDAATLFPCSGTIKSFYYQATAAPGAGTTRTLTFRKNGTGQALTADISGTATTTNDTTHSFTVAAGDYVSIQGTDTLGTPGAQISKWGCVFVPDTAGDFIAAAVSDDSTDLSATEYIPLNAAYNTLQATEDEQYQLIAQDSKVKRIQVRLNIDPGTAPDAYSFTLRINGASSGLAATIVADNTTGYAETDVAVSAGDRLDTMITPISTPSAGVRPMIAYLFNNSAATTQSRTISGSSAIQGTQSRTIAGSSRISTTSSETISGSSRISTTASETITGAARVWATLSQTITGAARLSVSSSETISGAARIEVSSSETIAGASRIEVSSSQTITGASSIRGTQTRTITGSSAITTAATQTRPISGASRIQTTASETIAGASRISSSSSQTITGAARISVSSSETISGAARIEVSSSETISGASRISVSSDQNLSGSSRISTTSSEAISGASRITATQNRTISGASKISITGTVDQDITGSSAIQGTQARTISGASRIETTATAAISGASRISVSASATISGASRITAASSQTISGSSAIQAAQSRTISGEARIEVSTTQTITGSSAIVLVSWYPLPLDVVGNITLVSSPGGNISLAKEVEGNITKISERTLSL